MRALVLGAGTMGAEIAYVIAAAGIPMILRDSQPDALTRARARHHRLHDRWVQRGRISEYDDVLNRVTYTTSEETDVDFVIEAVPEDLDLKRQVFSTLGRACPSRTLLATNTSALAVTDLALASGRPERVIGLHFFNPANVMQLVEVVVTSHSTEYTVSEAMAFVRQLGKLPVRVNDQPGFLVNRILMATTCEALRYQDETGGAVAEIDAALVAGLGLPMGPFALTDMVGLDVTLSASRTLSTAYGSRFDVPSSLGTLVAAGCLGRKSGVGFYNQNSASPQAAAPVDADIVCQRVLAAGYAEAYRCLREGVASAEDIGRAMQAGAGWTTNPLTWAD